jgi:hypothetical protein
MRPVAKRKCDNRRDRHHLTPKAQRKGDQTTVRLWRARHDAWHELFGLMSLDQIIDLLKWKHSTGHRYWIVNKTTPQHVGSDAWQQLFGDRSLLEAISLLERLQRSKYG